MRHHNEQSVTIILLVLTAVLGIYFYNQYKEQHEIPHTPESVRDFYGYIRDLRVVSETTTIDVDEIEFLSGEEARIRAAEDTNCPISTIEDCVPSLHNDFYLWNINEATSTLHVFSGADIIVLQNPGGPNPEPNTLEEFYANFQNPDRLMKELPFKFSSEGNTIIKIEQQYIP